MSEARPTRDQWAMSLAHVTARRATCLRRSVGCVLLDARGHVLATGYNGVATGQPHCNQEEVECVAGWPGRTTTYPFACAAASAPSGTQLDGCQAVHAECNAALQCRDPYAIDTAYVTCAPCVSCTKVLLNTSCRRIVFDDDYAASGHALWASAGRRWEQYEGGP